MRKDIRLTRKYAELATRARLPRSAGVHATPDMLHSTLGRHAARAIRAGMLAELAAEHWQLLVDNIAKGDYAVHNQPVFRSHEMRRRGYARSAPRHALALGRDQGQKIKNYQAVVPSTWNASPRDNKGAHGPYEASLLHTPLADPERPLEVLRTVHSFDPCMACACHAFDPEGKRSLK